MQMREVFERLDFEKVYGLMTDEEPSYRYDFGNLEIQVIKVTNKYFLPVFLMSGIYKTNRKLGSIDSEIPEKVSSFEQGVAFIAYPIRNYQPLKYVRWLEQGKRWADLLPWEQQKKEYENRPLCVVDDEWFRVAVKKLREDLNFGDPDDLVEFKFDGEILQIKTSRSHIAVTAKGKVWDKSYFLHLSQLNHLPKRIFKRPHYISVWDGKLTIDNRSFIFVSS